MRSRFVGASISKATNASRVGCLPAGEEGASRPSGLGWPLWIVAASLPWLLPTHSDPWTTFYSELLMAAVLLPLLGWSLYVSTHSWAVSRLALFLVSVSVVPVFQSITGLLIFPGDAVLFVSYIFAFAVAVSLGQRAQLIESYRLADCLFASLVIAALLSTGLALYQWLGLDGLGVLVPSMEVGGGRAVAHVGQANNLSALLVWGVGGLWWGYSRRHIGGIGVALAVAFLLLGVVLTGSRTGCAQVAFLAVMALVCGRPRFLRRQVLAVVLLGGWFVALLFALPVVSELLFGAVAREMLSVGIRPKFWLMAFEALADRPLWGYGWNQVVAVHVALADKYPGLNTVMGHAHNVLLDLLLWNGVVLGGVLIVGIVWWGWNQVRVVTTETHGIILTVLGIFFIHAMLELPHLYEFFLLPVGLMVGMVSALNPMKVVTTLPRAFMAVVGLGLAVLLVIMFRDYSLIEKNLTAQRMVAARITGAVVPASPNVIVLRSLQNALERLRTEPRRNMSREELDGFRRAVLHYPTTGGVFRYAQSAALNHQFDESKWALQLICNLKSPKVCDAVINDWKSLALLGNPEMSSVLLPKR